MAIEEEEVDHIANHWRLLDTSLLRAGRDEVAPEASRLLHLDKGRIDDGGAVRVRERSGATGTAWSSSLLPLVQVVAEASAQATPAAPADARYIATRGVIRDREGLVFGPVCHCTVTCLATFDGRAVLAWRRYSG